MPQTTTGKTNLRQKQLLWSAIILSVILISTAVFSTKTMLETKHMTVNRELEQQLLLQVQHNVANIKIWFVSIQNQIKLMTNTDLFKLFASAFNTDPKTAQSLLESITDNKPEIPSTIAGSQDSYATTQRLEQQLPLMRQLLHDFIQKNLYASATLINTNFQPYLSTTTKLYPLYPDELYAAKQVIATGELQTTSVRLTDDKRSMISVLQPVLEPSYVSETESLVGILITTLDVTDIIINITKNTTPGSSYRLLQQTGNLLQELLPFTLPILLPDWKLDSSGNLPFATYTLPSNQILYALALPIGNLPWLVAAGINLADADAPYRDYRNFLLSIIISLLIITYLLSGMAWWWFLYRREHAIANEKKILYKQIQDQKQLLDNVNSALTDGIVLKDRAGIIQYTNQAFAKMFNKQPEDLINRDLDQFLRGKTSFPINPYVKEVLQTGRSAVFTEELYINQSRRVFQVICSPFLENQNMIKGVVIIYHDITEIIAEQARRQKIIDQQITVLVRAIEAIDPYLSGHSMLTAKLSKTLAYILQLDDVHANTVYLAAQLSQIGMLHLPLELRLKSGTLTTAEREQMKSHVEFTKKILHDIDFELPVQQALYQMHEHLDGSGYPKQLQEKDINIDARILTVANIFCALMRPRAYRDPKSLEETLDILTKELNKYDSKVVQGLQYFLASESGQSFLKKLTG